MKFNRARLAWLLYDPANAAYALIVRTVFAPLLFKYAADAALGEAAATSAWGYAASAAGIAAGAISLVLGPYADRARRKKWFLGGFVLTGAAATVGLAFAGDWRLILLLSFVGLASYMAANSFYDAMLNDVASRAGRHGLSSFSYAVGYVGGVIPFIVCLGLSLVWSDRLAVIRWSFLIAALWWTGLSLPLFFAVRERRRTGSPAEKAGGVLKHIWQDRNLRRFLISYFLYIDGVGTIYLMAAPLALDVGVSDEGLIVIILGLQFLAFPCTLLYGLAARRFSARRPVLAAIGVYMTIAVLAGAFPLIDSPRWRLVLFIVIAVLVGSSQGGIQALSRSLYSRLIPGGRAAEYFSVYNLFGKFTTIVGPVLVGLAAWWWGRSEYGIALLAVPFALGAIGLRTVEFPGEKD